jgi:legumain
LAFDDIANDPENPFKGKIFNKPQGKDVYEGCKIDYNSSSVTPDNFLAILTGDQDKLKGGNGKVL